MNLLLLEEGDLVAPDRAVLSDRRLVHAREVFRAAPGRDLRVGLLGGLRGTGRVLRLDDDALELALDLREPPPPKVPLTLLVALPRPKVLNRVVASAASLGVERLVLLNAWKVEKAYWGSPRLSPANLRHQARLGLEQAGDTVLPEVRTARLFRPFVEDELPGLLGGGTGLVAHPGCGGAAPSPLRAPVVVAVGPEGGWIDAEVGSLLRAGLQPLDLGPRILRTETAIAALAGRLF